jgi:hypothetical protein
VEIALHDTQPAPPPAQLTPRRTKTHALAHRRSTASGGAARVHNVSLKRRNSPYAIGRKHYPYDPRELHAMRDAP